MKFLFILLFTIILLSSSKGQEYSNLEGNIDNIFSSFHPNQPGGVVAILKNGEVIYNKAFGMASLEFDIPNTIDTKFNIASVSKQITAYALLLLQEKGKLNLEDDVRKHIPELPEFDKPITIKHLLNHTSGLRNFQNLLGLAGWRQGDPMTNDDLLRFISKQKDLNFPVGEDYLYCNTGFVLATYIVERVTGEDFKDWTKNNIFSRLHMDNSNFLEDMTIVKKNTARSYHKTGFNNFITPLEFYNYMGNGNIYTTIGDLVKWMDHLASQNERIQALTKRGTLVNGDTLDYGLGIGVRKYHNRRIWSHGGSIGGYRSNLSYMPDEDIGVIILTNFNASDPGGKSRKVLDALLNITHEKNSKSNVDQPFPTLKDTISQELSHFEKYHGAYYVDGVIVDIYQKENKRYAIGRGVTTEMSLTPASDTSYHFALGGLTFYFLNQGDRIVINNNGQLIKGDRIISSAHLYTELLGSYFSPELDTQYAIVIKEGALMGYHSRHGYFELFLLNDGTLKGDNFAFADIDVIKNDTGKIYGLLVSNGRVRNVRFNKLAK